MRVLPSIHIIRVTNLEMNAIREALGEPSNIVFTNSSSLSVASEYFWREHERKFTVDGALRKHPAFAENQQDASDRPFPATPRSHERGRRGSYE